MTDSTTDSPAPGRKNRKTIVFADRRYEVPSDSIVAGAADGRYARADLVALGREVAGTRHVVVNATHTVSMRSTDIIGAFIDAGADEGEVARLVVGALNGPREAIGDHDPSFYQRLRELYPDEMRAAGNSMRLFPAKSAGDAPDGYPIIAVDEDIDY